jgi:hypothetical protein
MGTVATGIAAGVGDAAGGVGAALGQAGSDAAGAVSPGRGRSDPPVSRRVRTSTDAIHHRRMSIIDSKPAIGGDRCPPVPPFPPAGR